MAGGAIERRGVGGGITQSPLVNWVSGRELRVSEANEKGTATYFTIFATGCGGCAPN
jgi:hypothetical protein